MPDLKESESHLNAKIEVSWALQESYAMAVHMIGITDWSKYGPMEKSQMDRHLESIQVEIAKMILSRLPPIKTDW